MIYYFKFIIIQNINFDINNIVNFVNTLFFKKNQDSDYEFHEKCAVNSNTIIIKIQIHFFNHIITCFKYHQKDTKKNACKFDIL